MVDVAQVLFGFRGQLFFTQVGNFKIRYKTNNEKYFFIFSVNVSLMISAVRMTNKAKTPKNILFFVGKRYSSNTISPHC